MAQRGRDGGPRIHQKTASNGTVKSRGTKPPPPSTIAAQIVHNRTGDARQEPENKALFGKLLQEYLTDPVIEEANVETNAQLIRVVAEAGLDILLKEDVFAPETLLQQAENSLLVIQLTIQRTPEVLLHCDGHGTAEGDQPPLILWLLPKLLSLLARSHVNAIRESLCRFLSFSLNVLRKSSRSWRSAATILRVLHDIVERTLCALESRISAKEDTSLSTVIILPPLESIYALWPPARAAVVLPQGYQIHIHENVEAHLVVLALLTVIRGAQELPEDGILISKSARGRLWAIDCCRRALKCCKRLRHIPDHERDQILASICCTAKEVFPLACSKCKPGPLFELIIDLLWMFEPCEQSELQKQLESCLEEVYIACKTFSNVLDECNRRLLPSILELMALENNCVESNAQLRDLLSRIQERLLTMCERPTNDEQPRPAKRVRLEEGSTPNSEEQDSIAQVKHLTRLLTGEPRTHLSGLRETALETFITMEPLAQCDILMTIASLPCAATHCLYKVGSSRNPQRKKCRICDRKTAGISCQPEVMWNEVVPKEEYEEIIWLLSSIIELADLRRSRKPRVLAAHAMYRIVNHCSDGDFLSLGSSSFGPWLMRSLQSSVRELRIASAQALLSYLRDNIAENVRSKNRLEALDFFKCLTERNSLSEQETMIMTWGLVGRTCGEAELNIALIQLVDYLGHTHSLICSVAYHEVLRLAADLDRTPLELFKRFWSSVATHVVKDLISCPQKAQQLSELLGLSVNEFLVLTQTDTVPYMILARKKDVLQRIAQARGSTTCVQDLWMHPPKNLAAVMSLLLIQKAPDLEHWAVTLLQDVVPEFSESDLASLVKLYPILIACEILKHAGDFEDVRKTQMSQAFKLLAVLTERKPGQTKQPKSSKMLSLFFESHILGIMSHFTDVIDSSIERHSIAEKKRALKAIERLIKLAQSQIAVAMPQIRATLQSSFNDTALVDDAFSAWSSLVFAAGEDEVEGLIDHTFSIIVQNWASFSTQSQHRAHDCIADLLKNFNTLIRDRIEMIPSLAGITLLQKFEGEISKFKASLDTMVHLGAFSRRCKDESATIVHRALIELVPFLNSNQRMIHESALGQQPSPLIGQVVRSVMDASLRFKETQPEILDLCAQCLGIIGSIDPNHVEAFREKRDVLMLSNFEKADEVVEFATSMLETVLVESFHSAPTGKTQTYLAYVLQELLKFCGFRQAVLHRPKSSQSSPTYHRWIQIPEAIRSTLTPYFNTKYVIVHPAMPTDGQNSPVFKSAMSHGTWLRTFVFNLLHKGKGDNARMVFPVLSRVIWGHDIAIPTFLLPFVVLNVVVGGTDVESELILKELLAVLGFDIDNVSQSEAENVKQCSENIFQVLDYLSRWLQKKRKKIHEFVSGNTRANHVPADFDELKDVAQISSVERILSGMPADVISRRAVQCRSFSRALFHWEQHIRQTVERSSSKHESINMEDKYKHLQQIYAQIDELDGIEGISTKLQILDPEQQVLEHKRAGRWAAAHSWYELSLAEQPGNLSLEFELLSCLKLAGRFGPLLDYVQNLATVKTELPQQTLSFVAEASWTTGKWQVLERFLQSEPRTESQDFNVGVGKALLALRCRDETTFQQTISSLRRNITRGLSVSATTSLAAAQSYTVKLHALYELELISGMVKPMLEPHLVVEALDRRLGILGAFTDNKQYLLGLRRATMALSKLDFTKHQISSSWLTSARLHRKAGMVDAAYDAVLHATHLNDGAAKLEHSRLLWRDGHHRKAIQNLRGAIDAEVFQPYDNVMSTTTMEDSTVAQGAHDSHDKQQNFLVAKTQLLLAKWMDGAGQTKSDDIREYYLQALKSFTRWEKVHYYMGKYYLKVLDAQRAVPSSKQSEAYLIADCQKLIIENFMRSMVFGAKYYHQTAPKLLTLWLDLGAELHVAEKHPPFDQYHSAKSKKLETIQKQIKKYFDRLPPYIFYAALPQTMSRINHPHPKVSELLSHLITRIALAYPQQALWSLLAVSKAKAKDKSERATAILNHLKRVKSDISGTELKTLIMHGQRLSDALLCACEFPVNTRVSHVSLQRDLGFSHKLAPCLLVVPVEKTMTASLPTGIGGAMIRNHKPFPRSLITITALQDDVLVLSSLQRPRKLTIRGSDGELYGLLCKPKDDLRKDQRLMEFTSMIDRSLKRDVESSKRRLYIKTYAVTPLNEECGAIEWVDGLKPMRDILIANYKSKGCSPDYGEIRHLLDKACVEPEKGRAKVFTEEILPKCPAVLFEWFIETFPEPDSWFTARLRYTRSCAVMSVVGHVLGLGDRHGENILLEEGNGGCFHVDFNCLFDKGLTFEKPELVPFRLTHNMVDAFGTYGYEGPFRMAAELTLKILRQYEDTLMTIMETFLYDPTTDFITKPKKRVVGVPETPTEVLEGVRVKVRGLLPGENVPLSVDGYVDALIKMAVDPYRLASMYIGWCAFF